MLRSLGRRKANIVYEVRSEGACWTIRTVVVTLATHDTAKLLNVERRPVHRIKKDALFIVDGSYLLYRSFYAIKPLYTSTGTPTQATYGFCRTIKKIIDTFDPSHIIIAWDSKGKSFRNDIYTEYKATRQKPPNELFVQKEDIFKFLDAIKMAQLAHEGYEADDIIAGLAKQFKDHQIVLVCPDKDMFQLLSENLLIFDPFKERLIDTTTFTIEHGFGPEKVPFYYALLGDTSDNIPGVSGIGKKTAQDLVTQFESLEDLYNNLDKVNKDRTRKLLTDQKEQAFLSLKLFTLNPPQYNQTLSSLAFDKSNWQFAATLFKSLEFSSMVNDIERRFPGALQQIVAPTGPEVNTSIFDQPASVDDWELVIVQDEQSLQKLINALQKTKICALDTETTGCLALIDQMVGISFAVDLKTAYYIPFKHHDAQQLDREKTLEQLKPFLEDPTYEFIMHHAKFDQLVLWNHGIQVFPIKFDTLLAANLVRKEWQKINLKDLSALYLHEPMQKFKDVLGKYKTFDQVPLENAARYGAHDSLQTFKIKSVIEKELEKEASLKKIFYDIEMPFYWVLVRMEQIGITLQPEVLARINTDVVNDLTLIEKKIFGAIEEKHAIKPEEFNLNSPKQIERLLFDDLGLPVVKKSDKGQRSTDQEVLEELSAMHPVPGLILQHRELSKLKNTYLDPLPGYINPKTGRVHTSYSQTMVATGRLSSTDPNMQNIPASEGYGLQIRSAFVTPQGKVLMSADYSQIELRVLAFLSKDPTLMSVFAHNQDIHTQTAAQLFGVPLDNVTSEQRQLGKRINFSVMYGMSPYGLAKDLDIKQSEAKEYIEKYFAKYTSVAAWMEKTVQQAIIDGYVQTLFGHRRYIPELREKNKTIFESGRRMAINTPVQGTQADIMKIAMINIDKQIINKNLQARMILQIHDEIIIEMPESEIETIESLIRREMETVVNWDVPLKVTIRTGKNWGEITK
jgi:DNA polymerase-1